MNTLAAAKDTGFGGAGIVWLALFAWACFYKKR